MVPAVMAITTANQIGQAEAQGVTENKETYGATYFLTPLMEKNYPSFQEILARIGKK